MSAGPGWLRDALAVAACAAVACGGRPSYWDSAPANVTTFGLNDAVALVDDADHRVLMVTAGADQRVSTKPLAIGHGVISATISPDGSQLFVLSAGDTDPLARNAQSPSLTVIDGASLRETQYPMPDALANLAVDPVSPPRWAIAYAGQAATSFVQNPNELVIFDLSQPAGAAPTSLTVRSFGGTPQRLTFTPALMLPGGARRLLVVETDIDVTLLDLESPVQPMPQVTVRLTSGTTTTQVTPAGVVVDGFDPTNPNDARIALRAADDRNVYTLTLGPTAGSQTAFTPTVNLTDVGGVPSDIAFVRTDSGLRVAALVPSTAKAVLVDPDTSATTPVALSAAYANLSLVTDVVGGGGTDVAMLWNAGSASGSGVALWTLGNSVGQPYFSVEVLGISQAISSVQDVGSPNERLKILQAADGSGFFVLDLQSRLASPLHTMSRASLAVAPDGLRLWAFAQGQTALSMIDFTTLSPVPLSTDLPIAAVYDVARSDGSGRSLVAIHQQGTVGATVFDATSPKRATARSVPS
ncbi:MAG TPA: hypothetical protein VE987_02020, partial [Polyangiaceae bacterium]|nr:hypothetical protein [Polyangiaceae bacterium]